MSEILVNWLLLVTVFSVAVVSPGPDFIMVIRNSVLHGRNAGLFTAIGLGLGVIIHVSYTIAGLAAIIAKSVLLFSILKYAGAAYLIYVGIKALKSRGMSQDLEVRAEATDAVSMNWVQGLRSGFITNLLNPKATMFFLALFSQIIDPSYSMLVQSVFGLTCSLMVMSWFAIVAVVLTTPSVKARFVKASKWIDRTCGGLFIALGVRLALTKAAV